MTRTLETAAVVQTFRRLRAVIPSSSPGRTLETLLAERSKLLRLHYGDQISADLFTEEERRLTRLIEAHRAEAKAEPPTPQESPDQLHEASPQIPGPLPALTHKPVCTTDQDPETPKPHPTPHHPHATPH